MLRSGGEGGVVVSSKLVSGRSASSDARFLLSTVRNNILRLICKLRKEQVSCHACVRDECLIKLALGHLDSSLVSLKSWLQDGANCLQR